MTQSALSNANLMLQSNFAKTGVTSEGKFMTAERKGADQVDACLDEFLEDVVVGHN